MKLSDAIRLGAMSHPQVRSVLMHFNTRTHQVVGTCALGAAYVAAIGTKSSSDSDPIAELEHQFPVLRKPVVMPEGTSPGATLPLSMVITSLNDVCHWSRQQIADWIDTLDIDQEQWKEAPPPAVQAPAEAGVVEVAELVAA
jgi:hypothetical protein